MHLLNCHTEVVPNPAEFYKLLGAFFLLTAFTWLTHFVRTNYLLFTKSVKALVEFKHSLLL